MTGLSFSSSFTYHFPTRRLYAFVHCFQNPASIDLPTAIEAVSHQTPLLIPMLLLHIDMQERYGMITFAHQRLYQLEEQAGIRGMKIDASETNFVTLSKHISLFIGNAALVTWGCKTMRRQLEFMSKVIERYHAQALEDINYIGLEEAGRVKNILEDSLDQLKCLNESIEEQTECLSQRAQALIQTVSRTEPLYMTLSIFCRLLHYTCGST